MNKVINPILTVVSGLSLGCALATAVCAAPAAFDLCSPKNGDTFEVTKPLLFWKASTGASQYQVFIDDAKVGELRAKNLPVISYTPPAELKPGKHTWSITAIDATGAPSKATAPYSFTLTADKQWPAWAIGPFVRFGNNPILTPQGTNWEAWNVYNPGVIFDGDRCLMLYRGEDKADISHVGYAESRDGVTFTRQATPAIDALEPYEMKYGCEDARLYKLNGTYYSFYTGAQSNEIALCEATSTDGKNWKKLGVVVVGTKNCGLICSPTGTPLKVNGKYAMYVGNDSCGLTYSEDLIHWSPIKWINLELLPGWGTPYEPCFAIANYSTAHPDDIVLFIAGTLNGKGKWYYAISEVLMSKSNLTKKVAQLDDCIVKPQEAYESGLFPNCVWMNSITLHENQWWMHYGAGDRNVALATAPLK